MRIIIYGIGRRFLNLFDDKKLIKNSIKENGMKIIGFSDRNDSVWGKKIVFNGDTFYVKCLDEFSKIDYDKILITSKNNFEEIRYELVEKGHEKKNIILIDSIFSSYLNKLFDIENFKGKSGIEIGGPSDVFRNIYESCKTCDGVNYSAKTIWWSEEEFEYNNKRLGDVFISEATDMQKIADEKYDFVLSSNVLEHIANPLKALKEFSRIVKVGGGVVLTIVPMKDKSFDHNREVTLFNHLLEDYYNNVKEDDLFHLPEIINNHDYDMDVECGGKELFIERASKNIENRCLHHHVFEEHCLRKAYQFAGLKVIGFGQIMACWMIIGKKSD